MIERFEELGDELERVGEATETTRAVIAGFEAEMRAVRGSAAAAGREVKVLSGGLSRSLRSSFDGLLFDGMKLSDALKGVATSMANTAYGAAVTPVVKQASNALAGGIGNAVSGAFTQGKIVPFARGGVVNGPTSFPMRGATGLMGEAGPEAIMPLTRGADGSLGVKAQGGGQPVQVVMNIQTPDVDGFRRSQTQIAAQMNRALMRGQRNR